MGKGQTKSTAWLSPVLAAGSELAVLAGVNLFRVIPADKVSGWDYLHLGLEVVALLLGWDARQTVAGRTGIVIAGFFVAVQTFRVAELLAWPGMR